MNYFVYTLFLKFIQFYGHSREIILLRRRGGTVPLSVTVKQLNVMLEIPSSIAIEPFVS